MFYPYDAADRNVPATKKPEVRETARNRRPSLKYQVQEELKSKMAIGKSRHEGKKDKTAEEHIYSYGTYHAYAQSAIAFSEYCKKNHGCRYLDECKQYADEYLQSRFHLSAWTVGKDRSALAKLFGCRGDEFIKTPEMKRADIRRSRGSVKNFSERNNAEIVAFAKATGLRRHELAAVRGNQLRETASGECYIENVRGKGGKVRDVPVLPEYRNAVSIMCAKAGSERVFDHVPSHMPVHRYRSDYACEWYGKKARDISGLREKEIYRCRNDMAGLNLDRAAMKYVSRCMGHNRINVIAQSYLYQLKGIQK